MPATTAAQRAANNERMKRRHHERRAAGLCSQCGVPSDGMTYCRPCAAMRKQRYQHRINDLSALRRERRRAAGQCTACGTPSDGKSYCAACRDKRRRLYGKKECAERSAMRDARRDAGLCTNCGGASNDKATCEPCRLRKKGIRMASYVDESAIEGSDQWLLLEQLKHQRLSVPEACELLDCKRSKTMGVLYALRHFQYARLAGNGLWERDPRIDTVATGTCLQT